jgi:hypothetical protein
MSATLDNSSKPRYSGLLKSTRRYERKQKKSFPKMGGDIETFVGLEVKSQ